MIAITAALITACVLGLSFKTTRWLGIAAAAMLTFRYPFPFMVILLLAGVAFVLIHYH